MSSDSTVDRSIALSWMLVKSSLLRRIGVSVDQSDDQLSFRLVFSDVFREKPVVISHVHLAQPHL